MELEWFLQNSEAINKLLEEKHLWDKENGNMSNWRGRLLRITPSHWCLIKGDGSKQHDGTSFVKILNFWDWKNIQVRTISIGIDSADNTSEETAEEINNSLIVFDNEGEGHRIRFISQGTDASGWGVRSSLFYSLCLKDQIYNVLEYKVATCTLYALNLILSVPIENVLGKSTLQLQTKL